MLLVFMAAGVLSCGIHDLQQQRRYDRCWWVAADQLLVDVRGIVSEAKSVELTPVQLANGAKELLDEVATGKITGEEGRYSHTDLRDFRANVGGSQAAIAALRPVAEQKDKALVSTLDDKFTALQRHRRLSTKDFMVGHAESGHFAVPPAGGEGGFWGDTLSR